MPPLAPASPSSAPVVPQASTPRRILELDGLRGIAIALVLWHHLIEVYLPVGPQSWLGWLRAAGSLSWSGVDLFFVLSGFLIGGILLDQRASLRLASTFYLRRAVRILPLYYVALGACLLLALSKSVLTTPLFPPWVYALFLTNLAAAWFNQWDSPLFSPLWSLAVEEQFYLVAPWVVRALSPARLPWLLLGLIVIAWSLRAGWYFFRPDAHVALHVMMPLRMDTLACGALIAWAVRTGRAAGFLRHLRAAWVWWLAASALVYAGLTACYYFHFPAVNAYVGFSLLALIYSLVVLLVVAVRPAPLLRLLSLAPLAKLGRYSYFVYLWHMVIGWGLIRMWGGAGFELNSVLHLGLVGLALGAIFAAAALSWKFFEQPLLKWGQRHSY